MLTLRNTKTGLEEGVGGRIETGVDSSCFRNRNRPKYMPDHTKNKFFIVINVRMSL